MYLVRTEMTDAKLSVHLTMNVEDSASLYVQCMDWKIRTSDTVSGSRFETQCTAVWKRWRSNWSMSFFLFMFIRGEYHQCAVPSLCWSLVAVVISFCLNVELYVLIVNVQFTTGWHRSKTENYSKTFLSIHLLHFYLLVILLTHSHSLSFFSAHFLVSSLGLCNASYCPIHSINNWEHFMQTVSFGALSSLVTDPWH